MLVLSRLPNEKIVIGNEPFTFISLERKEHRQYAIVEFQGVRSNVTLGSSIDIQPDVSVKFSNVEGCRAKFAITAPRNIIVHREEVYRKIHGEAA